MAKISSGTMTVTVFAALVGLGGAFVVRQSLHREALTETPVTPPAPQMVTVPLAALDLQPGRKLTLNDIAPMRLTQEEFRKSEFRKITFLGNVQQIRGRTLSKAVQAGRPFEPGDFYADGAGPDIAERLQPGYRAVTVPVENIGGVNSFVVPGSVVDVLFRAKPESNRPQVTLTLLERIDVLAYNVNVTQGQKNDPPSSITAAATVTLAVTPQQAKILKVVEGRGDLALTLRNPKDDFQFAPVEVGMRPDLMKPPSGLQPEPDEDFTPVQPRQPNANGGASRDNTVGPVELNQLALADKSTRAVADGNVDRFIGNASERLTLEDLLGLKPPAKKRVMEVYLGAQRTVINFDEPNSDVNADTRISTPVVGTVPPRPAAVGTVQMDRNQLPGLQR